MKHGGTWDSNPGPMAFSTASIPTELASFVVYEIIIINNMENNQSKHYPRANSNEAIMGYHAIVPVLSPLLKGSVTFTYGQMSVAITPAYLKIKYRHDKWILMLWIKSPWSAEHHGALLVDQFCLYRKNPKHKMKP